MSQSVMVTGAAGFIGYHLSERLLADGHQVIGIDNLNSYYDPALKHARLERLRGHNGFSFEKHDISGRDETAALFERIRPQRVVNLAAQAGVRHSIEHPHDYLDANLSGFLNILEGCRHNDVQHLVFASSSSVYGANTTMPFSVSDNVDHPVSLYAATKKSNELMAHSYSHLYRMPVTGLRFFTVYGPWGRPDMALFKFTKAILADEPIDVYNNGNMKRDFTYIDDIVEGIVRTLAAIPKPDPDWNSDAPDPSISNAPYRLFNIGNNQPVELMHMIGAAERALGKTARKNMLPMQPGDVPATCANIDALKEAVGFAPSTSIEEGVKRFIEWYRSYYAV